MVNKNVLLSCLFFAFSFSAGAQTVDEIFSKYISFTGGEQHWKSIHSIVASGTYYYGGMEFPFTSYSKAPNLYKFIVPFKGKYFAQAFDGKEGWKIDAFKNETKKTMLTGKAALAMANEADVELESPFIDYQKKGHSATLDGVDTIDGKTCFKVRFRRNNADTETYYFDKLSYELTKKEALAKNTELDNSLLETFYSDYEDVKGLKIPFKSVSKVKGQTILTIIVKKVEVDVPVSDDIFKP